jgi:hypothetical protein
VNDLKTLISLADKLLKRAVIIISHRKPTAAHRPPPRISTTIDPAFFASSSFWRLSPDRLRCSWIGFELWFCYRTTLWCFCVRRHLDIPMIHLAPLERLQHSPDLNQIEGLLIVHDRQAKWQVILQSSMDVV